MIRTAKYILTFVITILAVSGVIGQCHSVEQLGRCSRDLGGFTLVRAFHILPEDLIDNKVTLQYVFNKNNVYRLMICDSEFDSKASMIVDIYDENNELYETNLNRKTEALYSTIKFVCQATGEYNIEFNYRDREHNACGMAILTFAGRGADQITSTAR